MKSRVLVSMIALAWADAGWGQLTATPPAATTIIPDTLPGRSLGSTVSTVGPVTTIDGGTVSGSNLFHSFSTFDVAVGDTARWVNSNPSSISNVINRVTGGTPSQLFGILDSTALPNADFFFINPAGIVFGTGAQVNVPAAAHFSTASNLHFDNGDTFAIATPDGSTLSVAAPSAFGFLGNEGAILFSGAGVYFPWLPEAFLPSGGALSLSAFDVTLDASYVQADGVSVAAIGSAVSSVDLDGTVMGDVYGNVLLTNNSRLEGLEVNGGTGRPLLVTAGTVTLEGSGITTRGGTFGLAGPIAIDADQLIMSGSIIESIGVDTAFTFTGGAGPIDVDVGDLLMQNSQIRNDNYGHGAGFDINVEVADQLSMDSSWISASNSGFSDSTGGSVFIHAGDLAMSNASRIAAFSDNGDAGSISISVDGHFDMNASNIFDGSNGSGEGGTLLLTANSATLTNSLIDSNTIAGGNAGDVDIDIANTLEMVSTSITSNAYGPDEATTPSGGAVSVTAGDLVMRGTGDVFGGSNIGATATGSANSGVVSVTVENALQMGDYSTILASNRGTGDAGSVSVSAVTASLTSNSSISSNSVGPFDTSTGEFTTGPGNAGSVTVAVTGHLGLSDASISSDSGDGEAGSITIIAGSALLDNGTISSSTSGNGDAGFVDVTVDGSLALDNGTRISTNTGDGGNGSTIGAAGFVSVAAAEISLTNGSGIMSVSLGVGPGGDIDVSTPGKLTLADSFILSDAFGEGDAGFVSVQAGSAELDSGAISSDVFGSGQGGFVDVEIDGSLALKNDSLISTNSLFADGSAGDVMVKAAAMVMDASEISSSADGDGDAGTVTVEVDGLLSLNGNSGIRTDIDGTGFGGNVSVSAGQLTLIGESFISSDALESSTGFAGSVFVEAGLVQLSNGSLIQSTGYGEGTSGFVDIVADTLKLSSGAQIATNSLNSNSAGQVSISVADLRLDGPNTRIGSENLSEDGGDAGSVLVTAGNVLLNDGAKITTNSVAGVAGDISFDMPTTGLLILQSTADASAIETSSGPGNGGVISIASPLAIISNGGSILALGESGGANVQIDTKYFITSTDRPNIVAVDGTLSFTNSIYDVSSGTTETDLSVLDASSVLRGQCGAVRATGAVSQLNMRPVGPYGSDALSPAILPSSVAALGGCQ